MERNEEGVFLYISRDVSKEQERYLITFELSRFILHLKDEKEFRKMTKFSDILSHSDKKDIFHLTSRLLISEGNYLDALEFLRKHKINKFEFVEFLKSEFGVPANIVEYRIGQR
ncbi:MAG: ImmA/IrrE family metallo-endopeptidase [Peptostreptococcaceae bacterium]